MTSRDTASSWGGPADLSAWEAVMWRVEGDHRSRSAGVVVEILDGEPDWERLVAAHARVVSQIPRLRERIVEPVVPVVAPTWSPDPRFDLEYHVQRVRLPDNGSMADLNAIASTLAARPLDTQRPPWEAILVGGLPFGRAAYLLKAHHSLTDGLGMLQLLDVTHAHGPAPSADHSAARNVPRPVAAGSANPLINRVASRIATKSANIAREATGLIGRLAKDPVGYTGDALRFGRSLSRVLRPPTVQRSPLLREGGPGYRFTTLEVPLSDLKAAGKAAGGTVNDAFLAGLLGGVRIYHEKRGAPIDRIPMAIPVSLRKATDAKGGNRFAAANFIAPAGEPDPGIRIAAIHRFIADARDEPALGFIDLVAPALSVLPATVLTEIAARMTAVNDLQASNMGSVGRTLYLAGARVTRVFVVGPRPGVAAMATMVSYDGICCIGINFDPDVIPDADEFSDSLNAGFAEVLGLVDQT
jgi:diacylglycerol O-acyltransferase